MATTSSWWATEFILTQLSWLDELGAWEWDLRLVAVISAFLLASIRYVLRKRLGIDWYAFVHASIAAVGAVVCVYLDVVASEVLTGHAEPYRSVGVCGGPLTSLHRILPAITMGYALLDLYEGISMSLDFALHGIATLTVMGFHCQHNKPHLVTPMLLMEVSTIFLTLVRADFFNDTMSAANQALFALNFFAFRIVVAPAIWYGLVSEMHQRKSMASYQSCFPPYFYPFVFVCGLFFHALNAYWFYKIVMKARRKIMGVERVKANNDLTESESSQATEDGCSEKKRKKKAE